MNDIVLTLIYAVSNSLLSLVLAVVSIFLSVACLQLHQKTKYYEYLTFGLVFFSFALAAYPFRIGLYFNLLIAWQLRHTFLNITYLLLLFHSLRVNRKDFPPVVTIIGIGWFIFLEFLILFWQNVTPTTGTFFLPQIDPHGFTPDSVTSTYGAGLVINGIIIYSSKHTLLGNLFYLFVAIHFAYTYLKSVMINPTKKVRNARRIWIFVGILNFFANFVFFLKISNPGYISSFLILVFLILISYNTLKLPESLLISQIQLYKAMLLYNRLSSKHDEKKHTSKDSMKEYINSIPSDIIEKLKYSES